MLLRDGAELRQHLHVAGVGCGAIECNWREFRASSGEFRDGRVLQIGEAHCGQEQVPQAARSGLSLQLSHDGAQAPVIRSLRNLALEHGLGGVDALGEEGLHPRDDLDGGGIRGEVHQ